nr:immunoglobulin heavy chain junction region [Macaca mulatta]MOY24807.1 immunoglobulin heavy chain junction region [Macaca mulatta]MOY26666.1 immunoglobulin heavy chain junction region [Macaca mulatta]MOY28054.1 immunoglobulin heavy chain junction region [Macaca mulatta]
CARYASGSPYFDSW